MKLFTVHAPPGAPEGRGAEDFVFVKDGFSWPALFAPLLWLLYHRMWIEFVIVLALVLLLDASLTALGVRDGALVWAGFTFNLLFAFEANDLRRARLTRKGWRDFGPVMGDNLSGAERAFFADWLVRPGHLVAPPSRSAFPHPAPMTGMRGGEDDVIGSLPFRS